MSNIKSIFKIAYIVILTVVFLPLLTYGYTDNQYPYVINIPNRTYSVEVTPNDLANCVNYNGSVDRFHAWYWTDNYGSGPVSQSLNLFSGFTGTTTITFTPTVGVDYSEIDIGCSDPGVVVSQVFFQFQGIEYGLNTGTYYGLYFVNASTTSTNGDQVFHDQLNLWFAFFAFFSSMVLAIWMFRRTK